jgi:CheY-like chemotaxis protein
MRLNMRPVQLGPLVRAAADAVRPAAEAKNIAVDCRIDPAAADATLPGDPDRLPQVFWNLLSNAAKFTPAGGRITVRLDTVGTDPGNVDGPSVRLRVTDTGAGIDPKFLPYVFDRFRQADSSSTRSHGGLGIGLTIVRHIVELHGGAVRADSAGEGQGATFTVTLPLAVARPGTADVPPPAKAARGAGKGPPDLAGLHVLIVDDEPDAREVLAQIVRRAGADVTTAGSTREALEVLARPAAAGRPDVLVSDIAMPDEDGYALVRGVRSLAPDAGGTIPAIAMTAYARDEDRQRALSAGFQMHLAKPVEPPDLIAALAQLAPAGPARTPPAMLKLRYG